MKRILAFGVDPRDNSSMFNPVQGKADMAATLERLAVSMDGARLLILIEMHHRIEPSKIASDLRAVANALRVDPVEDAELIRARTGLENAGRVIREMTAAVQVGQLGKALDLGREWQG